MTVQRVLITGTTSGVGRALLEHYVGGGAQVVAVNRRRVAELEEQFPSVRFEQVDVRVAEQVHQLVSRLTDASELPEIWILNAGINRKDNDEAFQLTTYQEVVDTNLYGVVNFIEPLTRLRDGRSRHVIAVSSIAGFVGNPYALGYHTSKRALSACFDVWSSMYAGTHLIFQQVILGPVATSMYTMDDQFPGWMGRVRDTFSASLPGVVRAISRFAQTRRRKLYYPWRMLPLYWGVWLLRGLIPGLLHGRRTLSGAKRQSARREEKPR